MANASLVSALTFAGLVVSQIQGANPAGRPIVEVEENVYSFESANNGAGPTWCRGSTCLVRIGDNLFASGLETLKAAKPLNNCRWLLFQRGKAGWEQIQADPTGRTREPCPVAGFPDGRLLLSVNPTLKSEAYSGPARPEILQFAAANPKAPFETIYPKWAGTPEFSEHSYRSFAADGPNQELILFQNIGYTHAEWAFRERNGQWSAQGQLKWPWGAEYDQPQPIRVCYPTVALRNRAVYFCGVSDIVEPYAKWRAYKKQLTGRDWDYDFRRLFYAWSPDITKGKFNDWIEVASRDKTAGWIMPCDLWGAPDNTVHILWTERALDERLREKFFPEAKQDHSLNYATIQKDRVISRRTLFAAVEGGAREIPAAGRFQVTPDQRLWVIFYVHGTNPAGQSVSENRLLEVKADAASVQTVTVPLKYPMSDFFTATVRAGSPPARTLDLLGHRAGQSLTISYARIKLPE